MKRPPDIVTKTMRAVKGVNTTPELMLRKALWARGLRYRVNSATLPGKPDIVFAKSKVAVFVDGDFWHGNQWKLRGYKSLDDQLSAVHNRVYWETKIKRNMERDKSNNTALRRAGWKVIRIWESDVKKNLERAVDKIAKAVTIDIRLK